jgi:ribose 5-phosphate isomerase A
MSREEAKRNAARCAASELPESGILGLGSGSTAKLFIAEVAALVKAGRVYRGVPTSEGSRADALGLGIPLLPDEGPWEIDVTVDGADEVDPQCNLIKGLGGALVREKIVAAASRRLVILIGSEKRVPVLGTHGVLPVEVVRFGMAPCRRRLDALGCPAEPRLQEGRLFLSDNGHPILDCHIGPLPRPAELEQAIRAIPGVVGTGLFLGVAHTVLIQEGDRVVVQERVPA